MRKLLLIFLILSAIGLLAAVAGILLSRGPLPFAGPTVIEWRLAATLPELDQGLLLPLGGERPSVASVYSALAAARRDPRVVGMALDLRNARFGLAKAQELRRQLSLLREAGKFVQCYLETVGEGSNGTLAYFLASVCDEIHLAPGGEVNLLGLYADSRFLRGTLEKLKIQADFNRAGEYKSASETYTDYGHSPASREAIAAVLDSFYSTIVGGIAEARRLPVDEVRRAIDEAPFSAEEARSRGLIDELAYPDEFELRIEELAGRWARRVSLSDFGRGLRRLGGGQIAVVVVAGTIVRGRGGYDPWTGALFVGSDDLREILREIAKDRGTLAVVLRIDSPGGSAQGSDLILREVVLLREAKPVVASLSDLAASGGYYIACKANRIVAEAGSLTGSIGVVGGKFVTAGFEEELLGVTHDTLKRGANADIYSPLQPYSEEQSSRLEEMIFRVYEDFIGHVADGRALDVAEVRRVAAGRIWSGADARRAGLVDDLGGLDRAIALALEEAGLEPSAPVRLVFYPEPPRLLEMLLARRELLAPMPFGWGRLGLPRAHRLLEVPPELAALARRF